MLVSESSSDSGAEHDNELMVKDSLGTKILVWAMEFHFTDGFRTEDRDLLVSLQNQVSATDGARPVAS